MPYISETLLDSVAFVAVPGDEGRTVPGGTAFLVSVSCRPADKEDPGFLYLITARHVLEESRDERLCVLINTKDGGRDRVETPRSDWFTHDRADVALWPLGRADGERILLWQTEAIPAEFLLSDDHRFTAPGGLMPEYADTRIEIGDEVFIAGLFRQSAGRARNVPVARFGRIARLPGEPLVMSRWGGQRFESDGFLVDLHSFGGFSGSPIIWRRQVLTPILRGGKPIGARLEYIGGLAGLLSAHFDLPVSGRVRRSRELAEIAAAEAGAEDPDAVEMEMQTTVNSGLAVVTSAAHIRSLIEREDVAEDRAHRCADR